MYTFGFIGVGHMGSSLAEAVCKGDTYGEVVLSDHHIDRLTSFAIRNSCMMDCAEFVAKNSRYIFLGVKPQSMAVLFEEIGPTLRERADRFVLITMAAGITMERLAELAGGTYPIIRIMPNTPVAVGEGCTLYAVNDLVTAEETEEFLRAMAPTGKLIETPEDLIDASSIISGCGPAYIFQFIVALANAGKRIGVPEKTAVELALQTALGSARLALETGEDPLKLCFDVCSPGGATIEGVKLLMEGDFAAQVEKAVAASFNRTKELGIS